MQSNIIQNQTLHAIQRITAQHELQTHAKNQTQVNADTSTSVYTRCKYQCPHP